MNVLGIDLSIRATGLAMLCFDDTRDSLGGFELPGRKYDCLDMDKYRYHGALAVRHSITQLDRWDDILLPVLYWAQHAHHVVMESYSHGSVSSSMDVVHELGGIVKYNLAKTGFPKITPIAPASVKKFVTGNGRADKFMMLTAVQKMGLPITDHNMADAFGLALFGHALQQWDRDNEHYPIAMQDAIFAVKYPETKARPVKETKLWEAV
jgi:Holliday junction resolvasome RuvABC endonuclease subunit